jgi:hypothetical protein
MRYETTGKRSSASQLIQPAALSSRPLAPPKEMSAREKAEWRGIVNSVGADWFPKETRVLLQTLCSVQVDLADVSAALREFGPGLPQDRQSFKRYKELRRLRGSLAMQLCSLMTKLRLTVSSRKDPDRAFAEARRRADQPALKPWDDNVLPLPRRNGHKGDT